MTGAEHVAQRRLVAASLLADEQREHHHDVYSSRRGATTPTTPGRPDGDGAHPSAPPPSAASSAAPESAGAAQAPARECPACKGEGEIAFNPGYPDPQCADSNALRGLRRHRCDAGAAGGSRLDAGRVMPCMPTTTRGERRQVPPSRRPPGRCDRA